MEVAEIFNKMADYYDDIRDLWYAWLYSRLHFIIAKEIICRYNPRKVLDVGCGTGFQSFLHSATGAYVVGIDIAKELIRIAKKKSPSFNPRKMILFKVYYDFVKRYNEEINFLLSGKIVKEEYLHPIFVVADAKNLPFSDETFDHVNCLGSTLSFINEHHLALSEVARVLKPYGTFFLEVESKWNMDFLWMIIDAILGDRLGYNMSPREICKVIFTSPSEYIYINYPFNDSDNPIFMKIKLFTAKALESELSNLGFRVLKRWTIHSITNLCPSTYLHESNPPSWLKNCFSFLAKIEEKIPIPLPGCSIVFLAQKQYGKAKRRRV
jgi:ubiquinone/menaquinone biosynthesis C-methylase UbiE